MKLTSFLKNVIYRVFFIPAYLSDSQLYPALLEPLGEGLQLAGVGVHVRHGHDVVRVVGVVERVVGGAHHAPVVALKKVQR